MSFSDFEKWVRQHTKFVAFSGFKGSGKDTTADCILTAIGNEPHVYCSVMPMAESIRRLMFASMKIIEPNYADKDKPYTECDYESQDSKDFWKYTLSMWAKQLGVKTYRDVVNTIGMGMRNVISDTFWITATEINIKEQLYYYYEYYTEDVLYNDLKKPKFVVIIPDIRYKKEIKWLKKLKNTGYDVEHWCILRKSVLPEWTKYGLDVRNPVHVSIIEKDFKPSIHEFEWCKMNPKFNRVITNDGSIEDLQKTIDKIVEKW